MNRIISIRIIFLLFLGYIGAGNLLAQSSIPPFKKGERVIFVGNSITHGGHYHSFVWLYYMTRFPDKPITIMNAGIGGESAWDIKDRLDEDVFKRKPTYMTLTFGMNDTGYDIYWKDNAKELSEQQVKKSLDNFKEIEERLLAKDKVTKVLIGGSPYDETTKISSFLFKNKNDAILKIINAQRSTAAKNGWGFVDFNQPMVKISLEEQKKDSTFTFCRVDRIHPDNDGQMVMAYLFLKAQGLAGNEVADVTIDANDSKVISHKNCKISKLKKEEGSLSFDYLAKALPYPLDSIPRHGWGNKRSQRDAMQLVPFMEEFNQERLQVANLEDGLYQLTIDGMLIDEVSSEQLANGINLADYPNTPQYQQAMKIMYLNEERFEVEKRFREYLWTEYSFLKKEGLLFADNQEAVNKLREYLPKDPFLRASYGWYTKAMYPEVREVWSKYMDAIVNTIYKMNKPTTHRVKLTKIKSKGSSHRIVNLRCDNLEGPVVIENRHPMLQWQLVSDKRGKKQSAYRILVASTSEQLNEEKGDYWDSGKIKSSESIVKYQGKTLLSKTQLYWKVMVWDEDDIPSEWSNGADWSMGLLEPADWQAKWIGQTEDLYPDSILTFPAPYFRKEFETEKKIKRAVVYVSGLGFYEMYMNGTKIGDQVLAPAVTNYDKRSLKKLLYHYDDQSTQRVLYNVFDVTDNISDQNNVIGVILGNGWYNQRDRVVEGYMWYDVPKMILQLEIEYQDGTKDTIVSDQSWKTTTGPILHDAIFTGEVYDARLELGLWDKDGYDDSEWKSALLVRPPTGTLQVQTIPFNKVMKTVDTHFEQVNDSLSIFTLPETVSGWSELTVNGKKGGIVKLRFISDEGLSYGQEDTYILKGQGIEKWEPKFTWHAFKKIEVTVSEGVEISNQSVSVKSIYTDIKNIGSFECSNELFNNIFQAFNRTMHANFKGIISSDPHRERLAYTGDGQVVTESLLYSYDMTRLLRKFVSDISDASNKNTGYVPHTAPFGGGGGGPAWGSAYVLIPWNYFCHYGDTVLLKEHYNGMKHWVEYLNTRTDDKGIVVREEPNGWCLGEWSTPHNIIEIPASLVNTAYFYHVTNIMANVADILNKHVDANNFRTLALTIKKNFNEAFYNDSTNHYWEGKQGADVFALAFGLVPEDKKEKVFEALLQHLNKINYHFDTGIMGTPLLLKVLTENGRADLAYKVMDQRDFPSYGYLTDKKNNTLWETWNGDGNEEGCGHCHPMFGSVVAWFYYSLAGIKPDKVNPGMKHFYIEPAIVPELKYCKASYHSLYGRIVSDWRIDDNGNLNLKVEIPANTSATVVIPQWGSRTVIESGKLVNQVENIVIDMANPNVLKVSSGSYHFVILK